MIKNIYRKLTFLLTIISNGNNFYIESDKRKLKLNTTFGHPLKSYLKKSPNFDRLLPYLSLVSNKTIIDIGSNIGDTAVLIKSINDIKLICVDPDPTFNMVLKKNIADNNLKDLTLYPFAISGRHRKISIKKNLLRNTGVLVDSDNGIETKTFEHLLNDLKLDISEVGIIKIDTDGYDWDCLETIGHYLSKLDGGKYPDFIYYEHQTYLNDRGKFDEERLDREQRYLDSLNKLRDFNYNQYFIFDNMGTFIIHTSNLNMLNQIVTYIRNSELENNYTPFWYCDVLISNCKNVDIVNNIIEKGNEQRIRVT